MDYKLSTKKLFIASDHAGFELKTKIVDLLKSWSYEVEDMGPFGYVETDDYPDYIKLVAEKISENPEERGIVIGGSGQGEAICANRFTNVRAALWYGGNMDIVKLSREHNNANVLSLGARFVSIEDTEAALKLWFATEFKDEERHVRRIEKIDNL